MAFIGSTGSGKSTLIQLIPRFYDVSEGEILIDGVNVKSTNLVHYAIRLAIFHKSVTFTGTIADNLRYGKEDATLEEMERAIDIARTEFVSQNRKAMMNLFQKVARTFLVVKNNV